MINRRIGWFYHNNIGVVLSNTNRVGAISFIKAVRKFFSPKFKLPGCRVYFYTKPDNTPEKTKKIKGNAILCCVCVFLCGFGVVFCSCVVFCVFVAKTS